MNHQQVDGQKMDQQGPLPEIAQAFHVWEKKHHLDQKIRVQAYFMQVCSTCWLQMLYTWFTKKSERIHQGTTASAAAASGARASAASAGAWASEAWMSWITEHASKAHGYCQRTNIHGCIFICTWVCLVCMKFAVCMDVCVCVVVCHMWNARYHLYLA